MFNRNKLKLPLEVRVKHFLEEYKKLSIKWGVDFYAQAQMTVDERKHGKEEKE